MFYEAFCEKHDRYRSANSVLIRKGRLSASVSRVLDVGAGTGRTAEAALARLGPEARVVCVEPSVAMRRAGKSRLIDSRIRWRTTLPVQPASFDRIFAAPRSGRCLRWPKPWGDSRGCSARAARCVSTFPASICRRPTLLAAAMILIYSRSRRGCSTGRLAARNRRTNR
ncbi:MAG: class I SAM-dependent methyltransferase [Acidobacteria bacterium]|nr:class I SAM-dependent methyltransferase [Acidobacteriota bacterium]